MDAAPTARDVVEAGPASGVGQASVGPGSPSFSIPAVKGASRQGTYELQAWPVQRQWSGSSSSGGSGGTPPERVQAQAPFDETLEQGPAPLWRRAWQRLAGGAVTVAHAATRVVSIPNSRGPQFMGPRTHSLEVLSTGREQSAPYLPSKRSLQRQMQVHRRQLSGGDEPPHPAEGRALAVLRWRRACQAVTDAREVLHCLDVLANRLAPPADRLHATVLLRQRMQQYQQPEKLAWAVLAQRGSSQLSWRDHMLNELYITGERIFTFFVPPGMGQHRPYVTLTLLAVLVLVYFFMAGQYAQYQAVVAPATSACLSALRRNGTSTVWGPTGLVDWIAPRQSAWCYAGGAGKFDAAFLIDWGARYAPRMRSSPERWLTSALLHQSFTHLLSNAALLVGLAGQIELKHGSWRAAVVVVVSALGGNLFSAVTEAPCVAVVGASGVVFGFAGCTVADTLHNFETLTRPVLRTIVMLAFLVFFAVTVGTTATGTSHMSHVGGFLCGMLAGLVFLRNPHRGRTEWVYTAAGVLGCVAVFVALPCIFYLQQLPRVCCGC